MHFTKMQGIGNDYVYVNGFAERVEDPARVAQKVSDRHFGIGSDGLILIQPSDVADARMEMYNADGSQGSMCGNGIRCVAKYLYDAGIAKKSTLAIETKSGIKHVDVFVEQDRVTQVRVDMGAPGLKAADIPVLLGKASVIGEPVEVDGRTWEMTCVSMGNPHAVVFLENLADLDIAAVGPKFERHTMFPDRVNTEFAHVFDRHTVEMRVWERGSGETLACGTGACAVAVAAALNGYTEDAVTVRLRGGDLQIFWDREKNTVFMTGGATTVFEGTIDL